MAISQDEKQRIDAFFKSLEFRHHLPLGHTYMALKRICLVLDSEDLKVAAMRRLAPLLGMTSAEELQEKAEADAWYIAETTRGENDNEVVIAPRMPWKQPSIGLAGVSTPLTSFSLMAEAVRQASATKLSRAERKAAKQAAQHARRLQRDKVFAKREATIASERAKEDEVMKTYMPPWDPTMTHNSAEVLGPRTLALLLKKRGYVGPILDVRFPWRQIFACMLHGIPLYLRWLSKEDLHLVRSSNLPNRGREYPVHIDNTNELIRRCYQTLVKENSSQPQEQDQPLEVQEESYSFNDEDVPTVELHDPALAALQEHAQLTCPGGEQTEPVVRRRRRIILNPSTN